MTNKNCILFYLSESTFLATSWIHGQVPEFVFRRTTRTVAFFGHWPRTLAVQPTQQSAFADPAVELLSERPVRIDEPLSLRSTAEWHSTERLTDHFLGFVLALFGGLTNQNW